MDFMDFRISWIGGHTTTTLDPISMPNNHIIQGPLVEIGSNSGLMRFLNSLNLVRF